jgi:hypothetical protein
VQGTGGADAQGKLPDRVCLWRGRVLLLEVKDGKKEAPAQRLAPHEQAFHVEQADALRDVVRSDKNVSQLLRQTEE